MLNSGGVESISVLLETVCQREKQEQSASALLTTETLSRLNLSIKSLPQKCQTLLQQAAPFCAETQSLDTTAHIVRHSRNLSEELESDYEILKLEQKNRELQRRIERNEAVIGSLRRDLEEARAGLLSGNVNPKNVQESIKQMKQKVVSYEKSCEKAMMKFSKLSVPEGLHLKSLEVLVTSLATLKAEEAQLKERADDIVTARQLRDKLRTFKR